MKFNLINVYFFFFFLDNDKKKKKHFLNLWMNERLALDEKVSYPSEFNNCTGEENIRNKITSLFQDFNNETNHTNSKNAINLNFSQKKKRKGKDKKP